MSRDTVLEHGQRVHTYRVDGIIAGKKKENKKIEIKFARNLILVHFMVQWQDPLEMRTSKIALT